MHEVLFTKGDVSRGGEYLHMLIDHPCNCVLVHPGGNTSPCHAGIATKDGQVLAIRHLIYWEGADALHAYVNQMSEFMRGDLCDQAHRLIETTRE